MTLKRNKLPRPLAVGDLLSTVFNGTPAEKRLDEGKIWLVWDAAVGKQIAAKARPMGFRDGTLTVAVASAPWMQQLTFLKKQIIQKVNERLGRDLVQDLYLKAGRQKILLPQTESVKMPRQQPTEDQIRQVAEQTASISDPELHEAFARLLTRHLTDSPACKQRRR